MHDEIVDFPKFDTFIQTRIKGITTICDRACENRACGLKYTMSFHETYLNTEMQYLDSVSSVVKPNKSSTSLENFVAVPYRNKKL